MHVISIIGNVAVELITNIIIEYLKHNKRLVVPKLGAFIVKQPAGIILFSDLMRGDDGVLRSLLMAYGVKELEANGMIDRFVFDIHHAINRGESYTIEGFGEFMASDNNSIKFHHKREPQVFGGNIKPPVEALNTEREKLQRVEAARHTHNREVRATQRPRQSASRSTVKEDDMMHLGRPEAYLRGLKYDNSKNKKRSEEHMEAKHRRRPSLAAVLVIAIIVGGLIWGGWWWLKKNDTAVESTAIVVATATDALTGADITIDTAAMVEPMAGAESDNDVTM